MADECSFKFASGPDSAPFMLVSGTFYLGTPTNFSSKDWETSNGKPNWFTCELHWIEVDGIKLNSPTAMPDTQKILVNNKEIYIRDSGNIADIIRNT